MVNAEEVKAIEQIMLERLLEAAEKFYKDPKNQQAYEEWKRSRK